jgi:hypothetical protein
MFIRRTLFCVAALLAWTGAALSQTKPQPTPSPDSLLQEQITKAISDRIDAAVKEYEARHPSPPRDNSAWWFNFWLVVFTGGLVAVGAAQCYLIFGTLRTAQKATEAADLSARAAVAIESPFIRVDAPDELARVENAQDDDGGLIWDVQSPDLPEFSRIYEIEFRNIGRTTAAPTKLQLGWKVALPLAPEEPAYTWSRRCDNGTALPGDNKPYTIECSKFCIVLSAKDRELISAKTAALWVFGALTYRDFLDEPHVSRFCWRWGCPDGVGLYYFYTDEQTPTRYIAKS